MTEYDIIRVTDANSWRDLEERVKVKVRAAIEQGWEPLGPPQVVMADSQGCPQSMIQAMVKPAINEIAKRQMEQHRMYADWWIAAALNGHCLSRKLMHGSDGPEFSDQEKIEDAMKTAERHIEIYREIGGI